MSACVDIVHTRGRVYDIFENIFTLIDVDINCCRINDRYLMNV